MHTTNNVRLNRASTKKKEPIISKTLENLMTLEEKKINYARRRYMYTYIVTFFSLYSLKFKFITCKTVYFLLCFFKSNFNICFFLSEDVLLFF